MHANRISDAQQRADVLRVFEQIEDQDQRFFAALLAQRQHVFQIGIGIAADAQRHILVIRALRQIVDDAAGDAMHRHAALGGDGENFRDQPFRHRPFR